MNHEEYQVGFSATLDESEVPNLIERFAEAGYQMSGMYDHRFTVRKNPDGSQKYVGSLCRVLGSIWKQVNPNEDPRVINFSLVLYNQFTDLILEHGETESDQKLSQDHFRDIERIASDYFDKKESEEAMREQERTIHG